VQELTDEIEKYFSLPEDFSEHWSSITGISCPSFIQNDGGLPYLELSCAWLTHCSIKGVEKRRDFFPELASKFENFFSLGSGERFKIYGFLLDAAFGNSRKNWVRDFKIACSNSTDAEMFADYTVKMGWSADRLQKHASKYFYPISLGVGGQEFRFLEYISSEEDFEAYLKYVLMDIYIDIFDMEKAFQIFLDARVQCLAAEINLLGLFTLAKRLFAIGWALLQNSDRRGFTSRIHAVRRVA
jgi:hypothetical protein